MTYKVPVDFTIEASSAEAAADSMDNFLRICYKEYSRLFNVIDYELPVGYPIEDTGPRH